MEGTWDKSLDWNSSASRGVAVVAVVGSVTFWSDESPLRKVRLETEIRIDLDLRAL